MTRGGRRHLRAREALRLDPDLVADEELLRVGGRHALAELAVLVCDCSWYGRFAAAPISRHCWPSTFLTSYELSSGRLPTSDDGAPPRTRCTASADGRACSPLGAARAVEAHDLRAAVLEHLVRGVRRRRRHPVEAVDELRPPPARAPLLHVDVAELGRAHRAGHKRLGTYAAAGSGYTEGVLLVRELERDEGGAARRRRGRADDRARAQPRGRGAAGSLVSRSIETVVAMRVRHATARHGCGCGSSGEGIPRGAAARFSGGAVVYFGARMPGVLAPPGVAGSGGVFEGTLRDDFSHTNPDLGENRSAFRTRVTRGNTKR